VTLSNESAGDDPYDLVLEYRQSKVKPRERVKETTQGTEIVEEQKHMVGSAGSEESKASNRLQTQEELSQKPSGDDDYKTVFEEDPIQDSDDENTSCDGATQAYPGPSLLAPESKKAKQHSSFVDFMHSSISNSYGSSVIVLWCSNIGIAVGIVMIAFRRSSIVVDALDPCC
jgi:hypothetical protein